MRVAAIDCGTNSVRLLVADVPGVSGVSGVSGGGLTDLTDVSRRMEIVRLGEGVDRTGRLSDAAIERTRKALVLYAAEIADLGAERVRMCATSASRDASNAADFRAMVRGVLGVDPEVISGDEEARLSFTGAVTGLNAEPPYLVVDIGGGSTEFVTGGGVSPGVRGSASVPGGGGSPAVRGSAFVSDEAISADMGGSSGSVRVERAISVDIGCVRMTERHLHDDPPTAAQIEAATRDITEQVDRALAAVAGHEARTLVGLAGSVATVTALAIGLDAYDSSRIHHSRASREEVARVTADLLAMTVAERLALPVMHPGRADVIGAGALILRTIVERSGRPFVVASEHDILDGIAFSLAS